MRTAIYTRFSSDNQREASLEDQERLCRQEADRRGWSVVQTWHDAALSGQLGEDQRPGYQQMMAAGRRREFDVLIVDDSSRLSRDGAEAQLTLKILDFLGIKFVARADGIDTVLNPKSSRLLYGIKSAMNEEFLRDLAEKTWRGLEGRARKGLSAGGLPFGYRSEPITDDRGRVTGYRRLIHEAEAETVRRIFRLYVGDESGATHSPRQIAHLLNREGVPPPGARWINKTKRQATSWSYTAIIGHPKLRKGILNNPIYSGKLIWNRSQWVRDPETKRMRYRVRPMDDWIEVDAPELRIIPRDLWDRARARMARQRSAPVAADLSGRFNRHLLSGFVKCGVCGGNYVIKTKYSYRCASRHDRGIHVCDNHWPARRSALESVVISTLRDHLFTPANLSKLVEQVKKAILDRAGRERLRPSVDRAQEIRLLEGKIENIKQAVEMGKATAILLEMLEKHHRELEELRSSRPVRSDDGLRKRLVGVLARLPELVEGYVDELETLLATRQVERGKQILASFGTEIVLWPKKDHLEAEIRGDMRKVLQLATFRAGGRLKSDAFRWLGEEDSNPR